jgi:NitT/TauT family transport system substrate-binding protein/sulfonate transport system substrate-binding protein
MKKLTTIGIVFLSVIFIFTASGPAFAEKLIKLNIGHQNSVDAYPTWNIIKKGLDKEAGLKLKMIFFDSGMPQIEAMPAKAWDIATTGGVPMLMGALRYKAYMVAATMDDGYNNMVLVRPDNPILKVKGSNPDFPNIYGTADLVKGNTILVPTVSSAHYALAGYLGALGLKESDVVIQNMEAGSAIAAFDAGVGDMVTVWAPASITGLDKGWKRVSAGSDSGTSMPLAMIVSKKFGDEKAELIAKFMKLYFDEVDRFQTELKENRPETIKKVGKFFKDWGGMEMRPDMVDKNIKVTPLINMTQNLEIYADSNGKSAIETTMKNGVDFFYNNNKFNDKERETLLNSPFVNGKFIKMASELK